MLPIGSIVYLKEGSQKLMIISRGTILESNHKKEYMTTVLVPIL